jgi:hypothetical protein
MKPIEQLEEEINQLSDITKKTFGVSVNLLELQAQLRKITNERVSSYFYNRYRDWRVDDLMAMDEIVSKRLDLSRYSRDKKQQDR